MVLGANGEVLGAERGAPAAWVGARLDDRADVPGPLREGARAVVAEARRGGGTIARALVDVDALDATVELVAVAAIGLHRAATDLRALLQHAMSALDRQAGACDVELTVTIEPDVPATLLLDPEKIAWAVSAVVGNSMRYVRRGTRQMPGGSIAVTASLDGDTGELVIVVADDGPGIPPEIAGGLFHRAPGAPYATGLALPVVRDVVTAHGGSMDLTTSTDELDHGTAVTIRVPVG